MTGDHRSARNTIDVYTRTGEFVLHRQVERRDGRLFIRLWKFAADALDI